MNGFALLGLAGSVKTEGNPKDRLPARRIFFWAPVSINIEKRCNHYRLIVVVCCPELADIVQ